MATRKSKIFIASGAMVVVGLSVFIYTLIAAQGQGVLAQAPMNNQVQTTPAFIMAVDDSGSMTFQTLFPGQDGQACWGLDTYTFFSSSGVLNTEDTSRVGCGYNHVTAGPRVDENRLGIPPLDIFGFARSAAYNPTYYDPTVKYEPWIDANGNPFPQADVANTRINPLQSETIALASDYIGDDFSDSFRVQNRMVFPSGTTYRQRFAGPNNTTYFGAEETTTSEGTWAGGSRTLLMKHWPATFFVPYSSNNDPRPVLAGTAGVYDNVARIRVRNACGDGCDMWRYRIRASDTVALQNFANWFSFYGNRNRAIIAGMTRSLADVNNMRVGFFRINQHASFDAVTKRLPMRDMATPAEKTALYNSILALPASGGTPNRQAVNSAGIQFKRADAAAPVQLSCQKNAVMLFTDGYSNGNGPDVANADGDGGMGIPFSDSNDNTMGDIAASYYNNINGGSPLRQDLPAGLVPVPSACSSANPNVRLDCQKNLHVNFYGITLGARGNLFNPDVPRDPYTSPAVYENWPARENDERSTVDDIWHAATNTRGEYINARTPADITSAMRRVLSSVTTGASPSGTSAQTGARIGVGSFSVAPSYEIANEGTDWFGRLVGSQVSIDPITRQAVTRAAWDASLRMPAPAARTILVNEAGTVNTFDATTVSLDDLCTKSTALYPGMSRCSAANLTALGATAATAVAYLRGDSSGEVRNNGRLRDRTTILGDIVNSAPFVSSPLDDYGYRALGGALGTSYGAYLEAKRSRRYMVYVGANDGMLHAFDGGMGESGVMDSLGGVERFAYVPSTALGHMGNLLFPYDPANRNDQKFDHRYYVDGPQAVFDTFYATSWKTTLVGAAGAGGRSVFALDVTTPTSFGAASRLWEISDLDNSLSAQVRNNIGHVLAKPVVVPVRSVSGVVTWKAIFGNGYNSASGKAVLFLVDIKAGAPAITMIEATESNTIPAGSNGLGSVVVVDRWGGTSLTDRVRDGYADTVYGADQKGAIWKFDLRNTTTTALSVPLFTTRTSTENGQTYRQPITGGIVATAGDGGGVMLIFGTGSFSFVGDGADTAIQSLYAVNDTSVGLVTSTLTRTNLRGGTTSQQGTIRSLAQAAAGAGARGWYVDLPAGERMVGNPNIASGIVFIPTYVPNGRSTGCASDGSNWLFGLNTRTGAAALSSARQGSKTGTQFSAGTAATSLVSPGTAPIRDVGVSAVPRTPVGVVPDGCWMVVTPAGSGPLYVPYPCGRQSWRQIQ